MVGLKEKPMELRNKMMATKGARPGLYGMPQRAWKSVRPPVRRHGVVKLDAANVANGVRAARKKAIADLLRSIQQYQPGQTGPECRQLSAMMISYQEDYGVPAL
jgi:hypothetical protein